MEANKQKEEAVAQAVVGNDEKQRQGYRERLEIREVLASGWRGRWSWSRARNASASRQADSPPARGPSGPAGGR